VVGGGGITEALRGMRTLIQWLQWFQRRPLAVKIVDVLDEEWFEVMEK
jgi:hypothetical protein